MYTRICIQYLCTCCQLVGVRYTGLYVGCPQRNCQFVKIYSLESKYNVQSRKSHLNNSKQGNFEILFLSKRASNDTLQIWLEHEARKIAGT